MAQFSNQATLSYGGVVTSSNVVTGEIVGVISVTKTAVGDEYSAGGTVTYVVGITNSGAAAVTGLTLTDDLGAYDDGGVTYVPLSYADGSVKLFTNGAPGAAPTVTSGDTLVFSGITVPAGGNVILVYETNVTGEAPLAAGETVTNTVTAGGITDPVTASATVAVATGPVLSINKALSPLTVSENGTLTYTFTVTNTGNEAADSVTNAVISDTFDPILTGLDVTVNGTEKAITDYTYDETTGAFSTAPGVITVPAATYGRAEDGSVTVTPGVAVVTVTGTV